MLREPETSHERQVYAHFIFSTEWQARDFARLINERDWRVGVAYAPERGQWRVEVERRIQLLHREVSVWLSALTARAASAGGDYDGWGKVDKDA